ncbi:MAG: xanthine dehydrogenase family protein molybdopterin-binding subunit, partial [Hyphomicrobiaceae bacterium]
MSTTALDDQLVATKFGVGQPVRRVEDQTLVRGKGQYTDDVNLPGQTYAAFVRSDVAHGQILSIDTAAAAGMPGVLAIYTGTELAKAGYGGIACRLPLKNADGSPLSAPMRPALPTDKVRFVGDPIACVVAETQSQAQDAAEAVVVDIDPLPAVTDMRAAAVPGAPAVWDDVPNNVVFDFVHGDTAKADAAFAGAHHVTSLRLQQRRLVVNAMEPRSVVAEWDAGTERFTLYAPTQGVFGSRATAAGLMKVAADKMRFVAVNVGGSFGMKGAIFPEYICALHAARALGRPVKWTDTRSGSYLADHHGRAQDFDASIALDKDGRILAVKLEGYGDLGAYVTALGPQFASLNVTKHTASVYRTPVLVVRTKCVLTNTVPITAYRGAGRPEGNYYMERLLDAAAREMKIDPAEMRRRNHVLPAEMPWRSASGSVYDCGDFPGMLDKALAAADWDGYEARARSSAAHGKLRGRGIGQFLEVTAPVRSEQGSIRFESDGTVTVITGTHDHGQGHATAFGQVVAARLGVPFERIRVKQTDSDLLMAGGGTGGSKSAMASGTALYVAGQQVLEKAKLAAAHLLEAAPADIEFKSGRLSI